MARWLWLSFSILFFSVQSRAIQAVVSHAVFYLPDTVHTGTYKPYVEIYWQINPISAHFIRTAQNTLLAKIKTDVVVSNETGILSQEHFILETPPRANTDEVLAHSILDLHRYKIRPGFIKLKVRFTDMTDSTNKFVYTDSFTLSQPENKAFVSDVQLIDTLYPSSANTVFEKNNNQQIPLCSNFYDEKRDVIRYYTELYHTDSLSASEYPLIRRTTISKKPNEAVYTKYIKADTLKNGTSILPVNGSFSISGLGSGNYYINVTLENSRRKLIAASSTLFQRFNQNPTKDTATERIEAAKIDTAIQNVSVLNLNKTFVGKYSEQEITAILKMMRPISDPDQLETINGFLKKPDDLYARYFIYNYFSAINKQDAGKAWKEYADKVRLVNKTLGSNGTAGYLTDRGFIFLKYGAPDEKITVENEMGALPYEVWQYNSIKTSLKNLTNAVFLFYRPTEMISGFELLHSTVPGETQNKAWRSYLYTGSGGGTSSNSRAEQYIGNR